MPGNSVHPGSARRRGLLVGIVAGEASGDLLGAGLVREIRRVYPDARFCGIAGPAMQAEGMPSWAPMEQLSVMGLVEVLRHLPELLRLRRRVTNAFAALRPDVVIGIDSPDFTLGIERHLRASGLRTVHYVSPSIWAWRAGRIKGIGAAADLVLCLLPFEPPLYDAAGISARFVGHPMADAISGVRDPEGARAALGVPESAAARELIALLPGSRMGEVEHLGGEFAAAAALLAARHPGVRFIAPMASAAVRACFEAQWAQRAPGLAIRLVDGRAREVLAAADVALLASGTATLEAALSGCPMVVAYRISPATHRVVKWLGVMKTRRFALPNLLAGEDLVPELIQDDATPGRMADEVGRLLGDRARRQALQARFAELHEMLRQRADRRAAEAVLRLAGRWPGPAS